MSDYAKIIKLGYTGFQEAFFETETETLYFEINKHLFEVFCDSFTYELMYDDILLIHCYYDNHNTMNFEVTKEFVPYFVFNEIRFELKA